MKKFIINVLVLILLVVATFCVGAGCGLFHKHTYNEEWNFDETYHYKKPTCQHAEEIYGKEEHVMSGNACTICNYATESVGLEFRLSLDEESYYLSGWGTCEDSHVVIPSVYENKPVTAIRNTTLENHGNFKILTVPRSIKEFDYRAFIGIKGSIDKLYYNGSIDDWVQIDFGDLGMLTFVKEFYVDTDLITNVNITSATTISNMAFYNYRKLTSVTLGDDVTKIGDMAFAGCSELTRVSIGNSVTDMGDGAFISCPRLENINVREGNAKYKSIDGSLYSSNGEDLIQYAVGKPQTDFTLPATVKNIKTGAISSASNLINVYIPNNVNTIELGAFAGCLKLNNINVDKENANFTSYDGVLYSKDGKTLISYPTARNNVNIIDGTEVIGMGAFLGCRNIVNVVIPDSVKTIGESAFSDCYNLSSVTLGKNVKSIEIGAFSSNFCLVEVINKSPHITVYKNRYDNGYIGEFALSVSNCDDSYVSKVSVDTNGCVVYEDGEDKILTAYVGNDSNLSVPNGVTAINDYALFRKNNVTSIKLPESVESIGHYAFYGTEMYNDENFWEDGCLYVDDWLVSVKTDVVGDFVVKDEVKKIAREAFVDCKDITSVTFSKDIKKIGKGAFSGCYNLESVHYNGTADDWAQIEFSNSVANPLYHAGKLYINDKLLTNANITSATKINQYAFYGCDKLVSVTLGSQLIEIEESAFIYCYNLVEVINKSPSITVEKGDNKNGYVARYSTSVFNYNDEYFNIFNTDEKGFVTYSDGADKYLVAYIGNDDKIVMPDSITKISDTAFLSCENITEITLSKSLKTINRQLFSEFENLRVITIPQSVTEIGYYAFEKCTKLEKVYYEGSVNDWVQIDFSNSSANPLCYAKEFYIYNDLISIVNISTATRISGYAFYGYEKLSSITIGSNVEEIAPHAFEKCDNLKTVTFAYTYGWHRREGTFIINFDVTNSTQNATILKTGVYCYKS